jgi:ribose transport system substrate-binding protein
MRTKAIPLALLGTLLLASCTSGASTPSGGGEPGTSESGGLPEQMQPLQARKLVHESMEGKKVAFVAMLYSGYRVAEEWGVQMKRTFTALGADFEVFDSNFDFDLMSRTVDGLVNSDDVDILVLQNAGDLNLLNQQIKAAQDKGIYVIVLNVMSGQTPDLFVGPDGFSMAQMITERVAKDCKAAGKTDIAVIDGPETDSWSQLVNGGVADIAEKQGLNVLEYTDSKWQTDLANQQAATFVQRYGNDLCAIITPWDPLSIAASQAVKQAEERGVIGRDAVGVYSLDASIDGCNAIRDGSIRATVAYDHNSIGFGAGMAAQMYSEVQQGAGTQRTSVFVPHALVDSSNIDRVTFACYYGETD